MSRIGKVPIDLPPKVEVQVKDGQSVTVKGPLGQLTQDIKPFISIRVDGGKIVVGLKEEKPGYNAYYGLYRNLIKNMVEGVTKGFEKQLEIVGVGYRADLEGDKLVMKIGYCIPIKISPPEGIKIETPKQNIIVVKGCDKQKVGQVAANIRAMREPEPYKGKGIRFVGEQVRRLPGKTFTSGG